jgi:hypothetical protein
MKQSRILCFALVVSAAAGCKSKATDGQINQMCEHNLIISGTLRGTSYEDESKRISEEYDKKDANLKKEMARDLGGLDDVLALKIKDINAGEAEDKEAQITAAKEDIDKKKKAIVEQFEPLIAKLQPQKAFALKEAREYTDKRSAEAAKAKAECLEAAKKAAVSEETATCRIQADSPDHYNACP